MTKVTNGDIGGRWSKNCHFCSDVVFERPLSKTGLNIFPAICSDSKYRIGNNHTVYILLSV